MNQLINRFNSNIQQIRNIHHIYKVLNNQTTSIVDVSDILRSEIVLVVSTFDYYIHELVRIGMLEAFNGSRVQTKAFKSYNISMDNVLNALSNPSTIDWFDNDIRLKHSFKSFQQADKVAEAIRLISDEKLWDEVSLILSIPPDVIKKRLNLIVDRRNKIAHEADMDPAYPGSRWPINENMVADVIDFVVNLVNAIHKIINP